MFTTQRLLHLEKIMLSFENLPDSIAYYESLGHVFSSKGEWMTTNCEFHGGSDSMRIHRTSGSFKCMNCGIHGGGIISYHMQRFQVDFLQACKELGVNLEGSNNRPPDRPKPLPPARAIELMSMEARIVWMLLTKIKAGKKLENHEIESLRTSTLQIVKIAEIYE
jgi:hypothetical protein